MAHSRTLARSISFIGLLTAMSACAGQRADELTRLFKENQSNLIQCQVDLTNASRDADLNRGQREVAEQSAEQATQSRLAVEKENQALRKSLAQLQATVSAGQKERAHEPIAPGDLRASRDGVTRTLSSPELLRLISLESTEAKPLKQGVLAVFGRLKSQIVYNPKNHVLASIAHFSGFNTDLSYVNKWNKEHRFGRLYLDDEGDIVVEAELDLEPGVRTEALRAWVRNYGVLINLLNRELIEQERGRREGGAKRGRGRTQKM